MPTKILGAAAWIGAVFVFLSVVTKSVAPEQQELSWWLSVAGIALVVLYTLSQWREIVGLFSRRQARYGALAMSSVLIAVGILVAINYITNRQNKAVGFDRREAILTVGPNPPSSRVARVPNYDPGLGPRGGISQVP